MKTIDSTTSHLGEEEARVRALCEPLRSALGSVPDAETALAERDQLLPFLAERIQQIPLQRERAAQARRWAARRWGIGLAAAAALLVAGGTAVWLRHVAETRSIATGRIRAGQSADLSSGAFSGEASFTTPSDSSARVVTEGGVRIDVAPATRGRVTSNSGTSISGVVASTTAKIDLMDGAVTLDVPPQAPGSSVRVLTPDATVTVHGTHFTVTYYASSSVPRTCVRVEHGKVAVDRNGGAPGQGTSEMLVDGESSGCDDSAAKASGQEVSKERAGRSVVRGSTLAQENALLEQALAAEQAGDLKRAEDKLRALMSRYPHSGLSKEAARALSRIEKARAER